MSGAAVAQQQGTGDLDEHWRRFGAWLRGERERRGESRRIVAARGGLSFSTVRTIEDGGRTSRGEWVPVNPTNRALYSIARALDLPASLVFERAGRDEPPGRDDDVEGFAPLPEADRLIAIERGIAELNELVRRALGEASE